MELKFFKPTTPSQRNLIRLNKSILKNKPLLKKDTYKISKRAGRNNEGKLTSFHKGGGHKQRYRNIDFLRNQSTVGIITSIEYDPYRNSNIVSVYDFINKSYYYRLHSKDIKIGDVIESGESAKPLTGNKC